ncbi:hypothetical protein E3N88_18742 [Mikania micrantha]|uniref:Retrotransposon Copia-like N-terminal domain-containing protein n=1 Tax=Mikania micrantha TaxID=192012 RepID=A0A5N6NLA2_9ASTR|nr:hypothetical protein E3N88_18742 [Mikania micrantha]
MYIRFNDYEFDDLPTERTPGNSGPLISSVLGYKRMEKSGSPDTPVFLTAVRFQWKTKTLPNPAFDAWNATDQRAIILLQSSLTEEAATEVLGLTSARQIWLALETAYSNASVERIHSLWLHMRPSLLQFVPQNPHQFFVI